VSMFARSIGTAAAVRVVNGFMAAPSHHPSPYPLP
jgi:hypothetical protein